MKKGQSTVEYFVMMVVLLVMILMTGIIDKVRTAFEGYFSSQASKIIGSGNMR